MERAHKFFRHQCVLSHHWTNGVYDCLDRSDEPGDESPPEPITRGSTEKDRAKVAELMERLQIELPHALFKRPAFSLTVATHQNESHGRQKSSATLSYLKGCKVSLQK